MGELEIAWEQMDPKAWRALQFWPLVAGVVDGPTGPAKRRKR